MLLTDRERLRKINDSVRNKLLLTSGLLKVTFDQKIKSMTFVKCKDVMTTSISKSAKG